VLEIFSCSFKIISKNFNSFLTKNTGKVNLPKFEKAKKRFEGLDTTKPDLIILLQGSNNSIIFEEAKKAQIPVIAFLDTNTKLSLADYPIPSNECSEDFLAFSLYALLKKASK